MFYLSTAYGFYQNNGNAALFTTDIRQARNFDTYEQADAMGRILLRLSSKQYYCVVVQAQFNKSL